MFLWSFSCWRSVMYYLEHQVSRWIGIFEEEEEESSNWNISGRSLSTTTSCFRRCFFGTFIPGNENERGSAICIHQDLLPDDGIGTHNYLLRTRPFCERTVWAEKVGVVNVHFEPELTLRRLCERMRLITPHWPWYLNAVGIILGDFSFCEPELGRFNVWNEPSPTETWDRHITFLLPHVLEVAQPEYTRRDSTALGIIRTLSRIDFSFLFSKIQLWLMLEIFTATLISSRWSRYGTSCHSEANKSGTTGKTCFKLEVQTSFFFYLETASRWPPISTDPFGALAEFKAVLQLAKKQTVRDFSRKTLDSIGAKLSIASSALRAYWNRHLGTIMRCCGLLKIVLTLSLLIVDFQRPSENLAEREAEITNLPRTQTEKDNALARLLIGHCAWRTKKPVLCHSSVTDEEDHTLENEDESGTLISICWKRYRSWTLCWK